MTGAPAPPADSYEYVSFSRPQLSLRPAELAAAQRGWQPLRGEVLPAFDFPAFRDRQLQRLRRERRDAAAGAPPGARAATSAERILEILASDRYRRGPRSHLEHHRGEFLARIDRAVEREQPVRVVIPSFPARPCNPLTHLRVQPDLGEAASFVRLHGISEHVREVHPPGVQFVISLDGRAYAPFYGYTPEGFLPYAAELRRTAETLGVGADVTLVDLQDLVDMRRDEFEALRPGVVAELERRWQQPDYPFRDELVRSMRLGTNTGAAHAAVALALKYPHPDDDDAETLRALRAAVEESARRTAFDYMVFLVTIRRMHLLRDAFPDALRGTVHPKPGQYSPYLVGETTVIVPWHGVAVLRPDGRVDSVYEAEILAEPARYTAVYVQGQYTPLYYREDA